MICSPLGTIIFRAAFMATAECSDHVYPNWSGRKSYGAKSHSALITSADPMGFCTQGT